MLAPNGTVVPAFDEAITILCIFPLFLEHFSLRRNFLTLLMLKYPEIHIRWQSSAQWMVLSLVRHLSLRHSSNLRGYSPPRVSM